MAEPVSDRDRKRDPTSGLVETASAAANPSGAQMLDDILRELGDNELADAHDAVASEAPLAEKPTPAPERSLPDSAASAAALAEVLGAAPTREAPSPDALSAQRALDVALAESATLKSALARQQGVETELRKELAELRHANQEVRTRLEKAASRFLPAAPVAFLSADGKSIAKKSFYALGRGESLETFLGTLFAGWRASGRELASKFDADGLTVSVVGDPFERSVRYLPSGVYLIRLSPPELAQLGELPPLVRAQGAFPSLSPGSPPSGARGAGPKTSEPSEGRASSGQP